jgi:hypothetical protein
MAIFIFSEIRRQGDGFCPEFGRIKNFHFKKTLQS